MTMWTDQKMKPHSGIDAGTGKMKKGGRIMAQEIPVAAEDGDILIPVRKGTEYKVFFYNTKYPEELVYTYSYADEGIWAEYDPELSVTDWTCERICFHCDGFFRVVVRDNENTGKPVLFSDLFHLEKGEAHQDPAGQSTDRWKKELVAQFCAHVGEKADSRDFRAVIMSDSHYTAGGIWEDTFSLLKQVLLSEPADMVVHLGDFTDGMLSSDAIKLITGRMIRDLRSLSPETGLCLGNHDRNYFHGNTDVLTSKECCREFLGRNRPWYRIDCTDKRLSFFFLDSFDPGEKERYGFSGKMVRWVKRQIRKIPDDCRIVFFSHVPPDAQIHVWSDRIRNGPQMMQILEEHQKKHGNILGWIHGHNHTEQIYLRYSFPVIGIGCSKLESFPDHKPEGSVTCSRKRGTRTQELWDYLLIKPDRMEFLRFGAGNDRVIKGCEVMQ